jgi:hypothetical protein
LLTVAIYFPCLCGQTLRADEDHAGQFTLCPACGRPVRTPSLHHANRALGIDAEPAAEIPVPPPPRPAPQAVPPMPTLELKIVEETSETPAPRLKRRAVPEDDVYTLSDSLETRRDEAEQQRRAERKKVRRALAEAKKDLVVHEERRRGGKPETHWFQCLLHPFRALPLWLGLAVAWASLIAFLWLIWPERWEPVELVPRFPLVLFVFLLLGFTCASLQATLAAAAEGLGGAIAWISRDMAQTAKGGAQAVLCFLAGPVVLAGVAFFFWLDSGELEWVDCLILWQLGLVAACYFVLAMLAVQENDRFSDANPVAIVGLLRRGGYRVAVAALLLGIGIVAHTVASLDALEALHNGPAGWLRLIGVWAALLMWASFVLRWVGISRYNARKPRRKKREELPVAPLDTAESEEPGRREFCGV